VLANSLRIKSTAKAALFVLLVGLLASPSWLLYYKSRKPIAQKPIVWEYQVITRNDQLFQSLRDQPVETLNKLGSSGWELVSVPDLEGGRLPRGEVQFIFKREK